MIADMIKSFRSKCLRGVMLLLLLTVTVKMLAVTNKQNVQLLDSLDRTLALRDLYAQKREARISTLKLLSRKTFLTETQQFDINEQIASEYKAYICDSVLHYLDINLDIAQKQNDILKVIQTKLQLAHTLSLSGMYLEAVDILNSINRTTVGKDLLQKYYYEKYSAYNELFQYTRYRRAKMIYEANANLYRDSITLMADHNSEVYLLTQEGRMRLKGYYDEAFRINDQRLANVSVNAPDYAIVTFYRALICQSMGDMEGYKKYLILSAMTDIRCAIKDNTSLRLLANQLFYEGDINRASHYIQCCMEDARFYNAKLRSVQLSSTLPIITQAFQNKSTLQINHLKLLLVIISFLLVILMGAVLYVFKQKRKLEESRNNLQTINTQLNQLTTDLDQMNQQLQKVNQEVIEANYIKENYIAHFLSMSSTYLSRIEGLSRAIKKKAREGNSALGDLTRSGSMTDNELSEFYENFDHSFLTIYPTFIEEFNKLLTEEGQIIPESNGDKKVLNSELRVFALIRLGIQDSTTIAKMLRYSVNTIYNVKAQVKNKAKVSRQDFESLVRRIGSFNN